MKLFLDTSVLLAACGSSAGASREVFRLASVNSWNLIATPYVLEEVLANLRKLQWPSAAADWGWLRPQLIQLNDVLTLDRPTMFNVTKDRPILFSALAWADVLLTLDQADFGQLIGTTFYGLAVLKPGNFLERERAADRLRSVD